MSSIKPNFKIIYHFSLKDDIVLFGKSIHHFYFICRIKQLPTDYKPIHESHEACIYIRDNNQSFYRIETTLFHKPEVCIKPIYKWFLQYNLKHFYPDVYANVINHSSDIQIYHDNNTFVYCLYDISPHIWCVITGMIMAQL